MKIPRYYIILEYRDGEKALARDRHGERQWSGYPDLAQRLGENAKAFTANVVGFEVVEDGAE